MLTDCDSGTPLQCAPLVFAQAAPDTGVLAALECPLQASLCYLAACAHLLRFIDLEQRGTGVPDREEQFRIDVTTGGVVTPVHAVHSSMSADRSVGGPI